MIKLIYCVAFISSNYMYQYFSDVPDYLVATERSYFQAVAMLYIVALDMFLKRFLK